MVWVIFNAAGYRWGWETFPSEADARAELRRFWKGTKVDFSKFYVVEIAAGSAPTASALPSLVRCP